MAAVHFEDWITRKRSLRPSLWESAYVGYQAVTSVTARTALGRYPPPTAHPAPAQDRSNLAQLPLRHALHELAQA